MATDSKTLGRFILDGLPPSPRGVPQVEVSFDIDANGILDVKAADKATGKSQSVRIEATTSLSKEEIEKLKQEALEHASDDKAKRELIDVRNHGESLIYTAEKSLKDAGEKVPADVRKEIEDKIIDLKSAVAGDDVSKIKNTSENLSSSLQKVGEILYKDSSDNSGPKDDDGAPKAE